MKMVEPSKNSSGLVELSDFDENCENKQKVMKIEKISINSSGVVEMGNFDENCGNEFKFQRRCGNG